MNINDIEKYFKNKKGNAAGTEIFYSIFVPVVLVEGSPHLLYQVRSEHLRTQPGEISFPGGKVERGESFAVAAVRETCEELGVKKEELSVFGSMDAQLNAFNHLTFPFVGTIRDFRDDRLKINQSEVESIFTVPLDFFVETSPKVYNMFYQGAMDEAFPIHKIKNQDDYKNRKLVHPVYFYEYQDYIIWGLTARITKNLIQELYETESDDWWEELK